MLARPATVATLGPPAAPVPALVGLGRSGNGGTDHDSDSGIKRMRG